MNSRESLQEKSKDELIDHILDLNDKIGLLMNAVTELKQEVERLKQQSANRLIGLCRGGEANDELRAQLTKAEQLWQVAQGRCDGLEEKLVKAEQRVAEWQPIETAPKDGTRVLLCIDHGEWGDKVWTGLWGDGWMVSYGKARTEPTHWMPLPKAPANGGNS